MNPRVVSGCLSAFASLLLVSLPTPAADIDAKAAQALAKKSGCLTCHSVNKTKTGPSFQKVAAKYKGKADGEQKLIEFISTGPKMKLSDGGEEQHAIVKTKATKELKNLANWILAQ